MPVNVKISKPGPVPKEALNFFKTKNLTPAFDMQKVWGEEHRRAFMVSKITEKDILKTVKDSLDSALEEGTTYKDWAKNIKSEFDKSQWTSYNTPAQVPQRLLVVYDTNMRMARAEGQWDRAQRTKDAMPYFEYNLGPSVKHRPEHAALEGLVLPIDDPFWETNSPPSDFGCKCWLRQLSKEEADSLGIDIAPTENVAGEGFDYPKGPGPKRDKALEDLLSE